MGNEGVDYNNAISLLESQSYRSSNLDPSPSVHAGILHMIHQASLLHKAVVKADRSKKGTPYRDSLVQYNGCEEKLTRDDQIYI